MKIFYILRSLLHIYLFLKSHNKEKIQSDIHVYFKEYGIKARKSTDYKEYTTKDFILCINKCKEFRSNFYLRTSKELQKKHLSTICQWILPPISTLGFGINPDKVGLGLLIQHGNSTIIHAKQIGDWCHVNQNVTIGDSGKGIPIIGNNVKIHTGAVVLGPITVGNNAIIGANATIVKNVPENTTIVPAIGRIIKENGNKVNKPF